MTETALAVVPGSRLAQLWERTPWKVCVFVAAAILAGGIAGIVWAKSTALPSYTLGDDLSATMSELSLSHIVDADANYTLVTAVLGLLIGVAGWLVLHRAGWVVTVVPMLAAFCASLMAWRLGVTIGTSGFTARIANASPGDLVQVDLQLRATSALLIGPFAAVAPVMLLSAFWPEPRTQPGDEPTREI